MQLSQESQPSHRGPLVQILHLEDSGPDRELVKLLLGNAGIDCEITAVETEVDFVRSLNQESWDLILSDFSLPSFDGIRALEIAAKACPSTPFIFVTGTLGEDIAVESLKSGATDYVLKQRMTRLGGSVRRALNERAERLGREKAEADLKKSEGQLLFLAYHDPLTNLPNRVLFQDRLMQALSSAKRREEKLALLLIDLDQFKFVNDSLGHSAGDLVLKQVTERLERCAKKDDTVARLGGDEFAVVVGGVKDSVYAAFAANRIKEEMAVELTIGGTRLSVTCSIGISVFPDDGGDSEILFKNADAALFSAKENGRNQWQFFTPEMNRRAVERLSTESALRLALKNNQFFLEYQPQLELSTGKIVGAEALIRWQHPEEGLIPPNRFIPIAENIGEIVPIGLWVLKTACAQAKEWQAQGIPSLKIAVNISAVQLRHGSLPSTIKKVLDETGLAPEYLELETTETLLLDHDEKIASQMRALREIGLKMAIDDFGTGFSSFAYVRRFRFDTLKIDGSFVQALNTGPNDTEIAAGIIALGKNLKMELVAECVETEEQLETLRSLGCDHIQGYYFSRPLGAAKFAEMVRSHYASLPPEPAGLSATEGVLRGLP
jgi:diguanylate cyclase (GGDEF)-like protein